MSKKYCHYSSKDVRDIGATAKMLDDHFSRQEISEVLGVSLERVDEYIKLIERANKNK